MLIEDMDDEHLDNSINFIMREMGNSLMLYEMGAILVADPRELNYDTGDEKNRFKWRFLLAMKKERERRTSGSLVTEE